MILVKQARVLDPGDRGALDVLVAGSRIFAIAPDIPTPRIPGVELEVIDGRGQYLVPGLVDGLVHISGGGGEGGFAGRTLPLLAEQALAAGVTTVIGCLGTDAITRSHSDLLATARALQAKGVSALCLTGSYALPAPTLTGSIERDLVLIPEIIGLGEVALADHRGSQPGWRELAAAAAQSRRGGMLAGKRGTVLLHLGDGQDPLAVVEAVIERSEIPRNQFLPTHCNRSPHTFQAACVYGRADGNIDFTTSTTEAFIAAGEIPAAHAVLLALEAGIPAHRITLSSDAQASLPAFGSEQEMTGFQVADIASLWQAVRQAVLEYGVALEVALATVTANPARIFGLESRGRIFKGGRADLLLVDEQTLALATTISGGQVRWGRERLPG
ncbi:MAG: beta-aspartyl-peptidase [Wenzhouxiangella sp.]|nr:MAG: beta-aspartyl-peptidase [Wenzhouxiangella sp.]